MNFMLIFIISFYSQIVTIDTTSPFTVQYNLYESGYQLPFSNLIDGVPEQFYKSRIEQGDSLSSSFFKKSTLFFNNNIFLTIPGSFLGIHTSNNSNSFSLTTRGNIWFNLKKNPIKVSSCSFNNFSSFSFSYTNNKWNILYLEWEKQDRYLKRINFLLDGGSKFKLTGWHEETYQSSLITSSGVNGSYSTQCCKRNLFTFNIEAEYFTSMITSVPTYSIMSSFQNKFNWEKLNLGFYTTYRRFFFRNKPFKWTFNTGVYSTALIPHNTLKISLYHISIYPDFVTIATHQKNRGVGSTISISGNYSFIHWNLRGSFFYQFDPVKNRTVQLWGKLQTATNKTSIGTIGYIGKKQLPRIDLGGGVIVTSGEGVEGLIKESKVLLSFLFLHNNIPEGNYIMTSVSVDLNNVKMKGSYEINNGFIKLMVNCTLIL